MMAVLTNASQKLFATQVFKILDINIKGLLHRINFERSLKTIQVEGDELFGISNGLPVSRRLRTAPFQSHLRRADRVSGGSGPFQGTALFGDGGTIPSLRHALTKSIRFSKKLIRQSKIQPLHFFLTLMFAFRCFYEFD